jgi:sialate O-acetylesterase
MKPLLLGLTALLLNPLAALPGAELKLAGVFQDHMVLQREQVLPVWGWAKADERVTVTFGDQSHIAVADASGKWMVNLQAMLASDLPRELVATTGTQSIKRTDILVGEVWLAAGQSNMGWALQRTPVTATLIPQAFDPLLRLGRIPHLFAEEPQTDIRGCRWASCTPEEAAGFSAVAYVFARELRKSLNVPVGVLLNAMPSSTAQAWTPRPVLEQDPRLAGYLAKKPKRAAKDAKPDERSPLTACLLYNARIAPLIPFATRGVLWYQGEGNNGDPSGYEILFPAMIQAWRAGWNRPDWPFLFVQLPPFQGTSPEMRAVQARCEAKLSHTAMVVTLDVGEAEQIHPANKEPVGIRLALKARALVYGEAVEHSGPVFRAATTEGESILVGFDHAEGMHGQDGEVLGFEVAGEDGRFFPAKAEIEATAIRLRSPDVKTPKRVRYAWENFPKANLVNAADLPAAPFRSE